MAVGEGKTTRLLEALEDGGSIDGISGSGNTNLQNHIVGLIGDVDSAKQEIAQKGGTTGDTGLGGLASEIASIPSGGTPEPPAPLDPAQVYANERPSDWLPMPAPNDNEFYCLVELLKGNGAKNPDTIFAARFGTGAQVEVGTVVNGEFVPDSSYTTTTATSDFELQIKYSDFPNNPLENGNHQAMVKIKINVNDIFRLVGTSYHNYPNTVLDVRGKLNKDTIAPTEIDFGAGNSAGSTGARMMKFCKIEGTTRDNVKIFFPNCTSLRAVLQLGSNKVGSVYSNGYGMFMNCYELVAIPNLDVSTITDFSSMFLSCESIEAIPPLNTASATKFYGTFSSCRSLKAVPNIDTSNATDTGYMFAGSNAHIQNLSVLNTSNVTNFSGMFSESAIEEAPVLDTSSGTTFTQMFYNCKSLERVPLYDLSHATNINNMFNACEALSTIPNFNLSSVTAADSVFNGCFSLRSDIRFNMPNVTTIQSILRSCREVKSVRLTTSSALSKMNNAFAECYNLTDVSISNTSSVTAYDSAFSSCESLVTAPAIDTSNATSIGYVFYRSYTNIPWSLKLVDFSSNSFESLSGTTASKAPSVTLNGYESILKLGTGCTKNGTLSWNILSSSFAYTPTSQHPSYVVIEDETGILPLGAAVSIVFTTNSYVYIVVPDSKYDDYIAASYWSSATSRIKKRSEVTLPDWYTA